MWSLQKNFSKVSDKVIKCVNCEERYHAFTKQTLNYTAIVASPVLIMM